MNLKSREPKVLHTSPQSVKIIVKNNCKKYIVQENIVK